MNYATIMDRVDAMRPKEAVDYLLSVIGDIAPALVGNDHEVDGWGVPFTATERAMMCAMVDASPRWVSYDSLYSFSIHAKNPACRISHNVTASHICSIRKKMGKSRGVIENMWGRGYRYIRPVDGAMLS